MTFTQAERAAAKLAGPGETYSVHYARWHHAGDCIRTVASVSIHPAGVCMSAYASTYAQAIEKLEARMRVEEELLEKPPTCPQIEEEELAHDQSGGSPEVPG